jgi:hypothetical protein
VKRQALLVLLALGIILSGCKGGTSITGKWEGTDETLALVTYEFRDDGTFTMTVAGVPVEGTYRIVDSNTMELTISVAGVETVSTVDFERSGDSLKLTLDGFPRVFRKTNP